MKATFTQLRLVGASNLLVAILVRAAVAYEIIDMKIGDNGGVNGQPVYTNNPGELPSDVPIGGPPPWYIVTVDGGLIFPPGTSCLDEGCHALPPSLTVELLDCNGNQIASETRSVDDLSCVGHPPGGEPPPPTDYSEVFVFSVCAHAVREIRVTAQISEAFRNAQGQCVQSSLLLKDVEHIGGVTPLPPPLNGTLAQSALDCFRCEAADQPTHGRLLLHKSTVSSGHVELYSLPATGGDRAYGETVNGEFHVSLAGQLIIEVADGEGAIDVWGGVQGEASDGWFAMDQRHGSAITGGRTLWWEANPAPGTQHRFRFHLRTYRGRSSSFPLEFHWYTWVQEDCCIRHETESLDIEVVPLPCELTAREPAVPQYLAAAAATDSHIEVRLPCCPACEDGEACTRGDTTSWFVTWPRGSGAQPTFVGKPLDGHANGWRLEGDTLWAPGADGLGYEFLTIP